MKEHNKEWERQRWEKPIGVEALRERDNSKYINTEEIKTNEDEEFWRLVEKARKNKLSSQEDINRASLDSEALLALLRKEDGLETRRAITEKEIQTAESQKDSDQVYQLTQELSLINSEMNILKNKIDKVIDEDEDLKQGYLKYKKNKKNREQVVKPDDPRSN